MQVGDQQRQPALVMLARLQECSDLQEGADMYVCRRTSGAVLREGDIHCDTS